METPTAHPKTHADDETPSAPGELELVRSYMSLHDHTPGDERSLPPSDASLEAWFRGAGLLTDPEPPSAEEIALAGQVALALRARVERKSDADDLKASAELLDAVADDAGLHISFRSDSGPGGVRLDSTKGGLSRALGRLLGIAFLADLDGSWEHLKGCSNPTCMSVFFDRSKNHSGKWCSMQSCGNRAKVRAFRERRAAS
jgi:predicted RNA-binding Zn ribbon-like protein